jgi:hypothetical protein
MNSVVRKGRCSPRKVDEVAADTTVDHHPRRESFSHGAGRFGLSNITLPPAATYLYNTAALLAIGVVAIRRRRPIAS